MSKQKNKVVSDPVFISVLEASKRFGYTRGAIYNLRERKQIDSKIINDAVYVSVSDLEKRVLAHPPRVIGKRRRYKKNKFQVVQMPVQSSTTQNDSFGLGVIILAVVMGTLIGFLITQLIR